MIRGVFNPVLIQRFRQRAERAFAQRQQEFERKTLHPGYAKNYHYGRMTYLSLRELDAPGEPTFQVMRLLQRSPLLPLLVQFYQQAVWFNQLESNIRYLKADDVSGYVPFHQDGPFRMDPAYPQLNCWLPLVACGDAMPAPGLEVIPAGQKAMFPFRARNEQASPYHDYALDTDRVLTHFGVAACWHPPLWPGDVLLMDAYVLHRSGWHPQITADRYSLELRVLAADTLAPTLREQYGLVRLSQPG